MSQFQAVYYPFCNEDLLCLIPGLVFDLSYKFLLALDDLAILAVSEQLKVDPRLERTNVDLCLGHLLHFLGLLCAHIIYP